MYLYAKLRCGRVLKRSLSARLMLVVTFIHFLFDWWIACSFCLKTVWMDVKFMDISAS